MYFPQQTIQKDLTAKTIITKICPPKPTNDQQQLQNSISCLAWNYNHTYNVPFLAATDWLGHLRLYRITLQNNLNTIAELKDHQQYADVSLLKCCWSSKESTVCFFGDSNGGISSYDIGKQLEHKLGQQQRSISSLQYLQNYNLLASSGYQACCKFWDDKQASCIMSLQLPGKILCSSHNQNYIVYGLSNYYLAIVDIRKGPKYEIAPSPFGHCSQLQSLALHSQRDTFVAGSFDGRLAVAPLLQNRQTGSILGKQIAYFKAHFYETKDSQGQIVNIQFPINNVGFSPSNPNWVYSAGSSSRLIFLDYVKKKKVRFYEKGSPFTAVAITNDGGCMAYSNGNDWHTGKNQDWETQITIRLMRKTDYFLND